MSVTSNPDYKEIASSAQGFLDFDGGNETRCRSKYTDAAKFRVGGPQGGTFSFDVVAGDPTDPNAAATEVAYIGGGLSDFTRNIPGNMTGMLSIIIRDDSIPAAPDGNQDPKEVVCARLYIGPLPEGQEPLQLHTDWIASLRRQIAGALNNRLVAGNFWLQVQTDGNVVIYDATDPTNPKPTADLFQLKAMLSSLGQNFTY